MPFPDAHRLDRPLLLAPLLRQIAVGDRAPRRAFEIAELASLHRPQERGEAEAAERQREGDEIDEHVHARAPALRVRSAFADRDRRVDRLRPRPPQSRSQAARTKADGETN